MARQARALRSRRRILDAAGTVFVRHGFGGATLREVTTNAGLTGGAISFHYASKEALARDVILVEEHVASLIRAKYDDEGSDGRALNIIRLICLLREWATLIKTTPIVGGAIRLIVERTDVMDDEYESWGHWVTKIEAMLAAAQRDGELQDGVDVAELSEFVAESFTGLQLVSAAATQYADFLDRFDRAWRITARAVLSPSVADRFDRELHSLSCLPIDSDTPPLDVDDVITHYLAN